MESKVREATNNEPWGCPSSVMQEIANGTYNYQTLNEIMPMIYKRFTEKSAEEWRQIYKALQLLEFLIKNGAERVIDDIRSHLSLLKMLRQFHYTDENGKDQGINVRNRSKELVELLSDVERIRAERKKARQTRNKYGGVEGGAGLGPTSSSTSRYGGFGSETAVGGGYGGFSGGVYGDGGGFGGAPDDDDNQYSTTQAHRDKFEEYDEYDEGAVAAAGRQNQNKNTTSGASSSRSKTTSTSTAKPPPPKAKQPEVDLFDFSADDTPIMSAPVSNGKQPAAAVVDDEFGDMQSGGAAGDDEFDEFQAAPAALPPPTSTSTVTSATHFAAPAPLAAPSQTQGLNNIYTTMSPPPTTASAGPNYAAFNMPAPTQRQQPAAMPSMQPQAPRPSGYQASTPNYFTSVQATASPTPSMGGITSPVSGAKPAAARPAGGADPFAGLMGGMGVKKAGTPSNKGPSMADLAKQKTSASIWGAPAASSTQQGGSTGGSGNDLLF